MAPPRPEAVGKTRPLGPTTVAGALLLAGALLCAASPLVGAQDLLRQRFQQPPAPMQNPLANIQLPPQLAHLTPAQLHQLAQLRELQLQQQAAAAGSNGAPPTSGGSEPPPADATLAPAPIGAAELMSNVSPTSQPASAGQPNLQIPQPTTASTSSSAGSGSSDTNERHDDGTYTESNTEMEGVLQSGAGGSSVAPASTSGGSTESSTQAPATAMAPGGAVPTFEVNWNKCPQLEPSEVEKNKKTQVITKCLQSAPIPSNLTRENVETHREQIATCALRVEGWFDELGNYKYDKAESEIRAKKLEPTIEVQVLKFHVACKDESSKKFPREQNKLIDQVQFYQACMDYYISIVCEIEVSVDQ